MVKSGCCGDKEFLKLYSYTLVDYPIVVQLDLDSLIVQPLDDLFDAMFDSKRDLPSPAEPTTTARNFVFPGMPPHVAAMTRAMMAW